MSPPVRVVINAVALVLALVCGAARADVVAVVSAKSPVAHLTRTEVADLFLGRSSHFPDGGHAVPIDQAEGTPARDEFYVTFTGKSAAQLKAYWSKIIFTGRGQPPRTAANDVEVRKVVAANPNAIAYLQRGAVDASVKVLTIP